MIRMIQSSSADHAKAYFNDALQKTDYYLDRQEMQGRFFGLLADRIGMDKTATKESFFALCENINPVTGDPLTPRTREDRTTGYDINFHVPKSVSVLNFLSKDDHILNAFQSSVLETMKHIEADSMTRVRKKGVYEDRQTGELAWAEFTHLTARPVDGSTPDPHLHSHCFVFNATWDEKENQIKAGQFRDINRDMPYYQSRFHKTLSDKLMNLGYRIRLTDKSFEIKGVPQPVIDLFSKRTDEIGEFAKEKGITDAKALGELGARTRSRKQKGLSMAELKQEWRKQIKELGDFSPDEENRLIRHAPQKESLKEVTADNCLDYALSHSFERASVMPDRRLLATAYRHGVGEIAVTLDAITDAFKNDSRIIRVKEKNRSYCTTREVLGEEKRMVTLARQGQGTFRPLYKDVPKLNLFEQQNNAIEHVLTTSHRVSIIMGAAGSGKTRLMGTAIPLIEQAGKKVIVVAPTAEASRGVLASEGFGEATTVARLLIDKELQNDLKGQVLWVDEAGLLGTKDMVALLALAVKQDARLILGGDTRQHAAVVRGDALRILNAIGGIRAAEVNKIVRQKNVHYLAAVQDLAKGNVGDAFVKLNSIGAIKNVDPLKPNDTLVGDYIKTIKKGRTALIVSPTHKQGDAVTDEVRAKLRSAGLLGKRELKAVKLGNLNLTEAEKSDWRNFEQGQIVQFNQNVPKIKRGSSWAIAEVTEKAIRLQNDKGEKRVLPQDKASAYDLYRQSEIDLSIGDKVKITRNGFDKRDKRLNNGQSLEVVSISKSGKIVLSSITSKATYELDKDFGHLDHAYCTTSYSSQGKTVDEVFISQPASTFMATDAKQFYVSVSRGKHKATIYTDDRVALLEHASELGDRKSALELTGRMDHSKYVLQIEREGDVTKLNLPFPHIDKNQQHDKEQDYEPGF